MDALLREGESGIVLPLNSIFFSLLQCAVMLCFSSMCKFLWFVFKSLYNNTP
jgi:hypothetical protein